MIKRIIFFGILIFTISCNNGNSNTQNTDERFEVIEYYDNGMMESITPYAKKGVIDGVVKEWYDNGLPRIEWQFQEGVMHGIHNTYSSVGGCILQNYEKGKLDGLEYVVLISGDTFEINRYEDGDFVELIYKNNDLSKDGLSQ